MAQQHSLGSRAGKVAGAARPAAAAAGWLAARGADGRTRCCVWC